MDTLLPVTANNLSPRQRIVQLHLHFMLAHKRWFALYRATYNYSFSSSSQAMCSFNAFKQCFTLILHHLSAFLKLPNAICSFSWLLKSTFGVRPITYIFILMVVFYCPPLSFHPKVLAGLEILHLSLLFFDFLRGRLNSVDII